jgi:predicted MFS family arabinose efflux permease
VLTGIVTFALPLLLALRGFQQEEIGQTIMMYGIGVVLSSSYVAGIVDRSGRTELFLFCGALLSGCGLLMVGAVGSTGVMASWLPTTPLMIAGVVLVGVAHGFINAPIITHVAKLRIAAQVGATSVASTYRFLERVGHIFGPMLMGQCFLVFGEDLRIITWSGAIAAACGLLFILSSLAAQRHGHRAKEIAP